MAVFTMMPASSAGITAGSTGLIQTLKKQIVGGTTDVLKVGTEINEEIGYIDDVFTQNTTTEKGLLAVISTDSTVNDTVTITGTENDYYTIMIFGRPGGTVV